MFYATHGILLSGDFKVFVADLALGARLPAWVSLVARMVKIHLPMQERRVGSLGQKDSLEKKMAICSSILAWGTPWMQEPGGLQSTGSQRVGPNLVSKQQLPVCGCLGDREPSGLCTDSCMGRTSKYCALHLHEVTLLANWFFKSLQVKLETCSLQIQLTP